MLSSFQYFFLLRFTLLVVLSLPARDRQHDFLAVWLWLTDFLTNVTFQSGNTTSFTNALLLLLTFTWGKNVAFTRVAGVSFRVNNFEYDVVYTKHFIKIFFFCDFFIKLFFLFFFFQSNKYRYVWWNKQTVK